MTIQSGEYAVPVGPADPAHPNPAAPGLRISAGELEGLASTYFGAVEFAFENALPSWIEIDQLELDFGTPDQNRSVLIPWGADIETWQQATYERNAIRQANTEAALAVLGIAGAIGQASHPRGAAGRIGGLLAVGALAGALAADSTGSRTTTDTGEMGASAVEKFPAGSLLNLPIRIPPGLFVKRWLLLNTNEYPLGGCIHSVILSYRVSHTSGPPESHKALVNFKTRSSEWQTLSCRANFATGVTNH